MVAQPCATAACCRRHPRSCRGDATAVAAAVAANAVSGFTSAAPRRAITRLTDWVCSKAAEARSAMSCDKCDWWRPADLIDPAHTRNPPQLLPPTAATTVWVICVSKPSNSDDELNSKHLELAMVAVASARLHAPSLAPYVMYIHRPDQTLTADDVFSDRLRAMGARVIPHRLSFFEMIPTSKLTGGSQKHLNFGAFGRLDIPRVIDSIRPELRDRGLDSERVLYTDTDVRHPLVAHCSRTMGHVSIQPPSARCLSGPLCCRL